MPVNTPNDNLIINLLFRLISFAVCGTQKLDEDEKKSVSQNLEAIYKLSKKHDVSHIAAYSVFENGIEACDELKTKLKKQLMIAVTRYERLNFELDEICRCLENAKIKNIPLKGSVIRDKYPVPYLRTSCDIDVLVHRDELENAQNSLCSELGYVSLGKTGHDIAMKSPSGMTVELHFELVEDGRVNGAGTVLEKVWDYTLPCQNYEYRLSLTDEMFYLFHIAHMAKHFEVGGCGIKPLIDHWVLNNKVGFDEQKRIQLLKEAKLDVFEKQIGNLCNVWLSNEKHTDVTKKMQDYILYGGTYGNMDNSVAVKQSKKGTKAAYLKSRIWLPYETLERIYPSLSKHKWCYPFYQIRRWTRLLVTDSERVNRRIKTSSETSNDKMKEISDLLYNVGLDN